MTKRKKARMKKAPIVFLVILSLILGICFIMRTYDLKLIASINKLEKLGYNKLEIDTISKDEETLNYAINNDYNESLITFMNASGFDVNKLNDYQTYLENNNNANIDDVVLIVNNDIDYKYDNVLVSVVKEKYFIKDRINRYMKYAEDFPSLNSYKIVTYVNSNLDFDYYTNVSDSDTSLKTLMLVNKYYKLDENYSLDLVEMDMKYSKREDSMLNKEAYEAFKRLSDAARLEDLSILNQSAYRSYNTQSDLYNNYLKQDGLEWTDKWSARPGHSEHQTGLALDVLTKDCTSLGEFEKTEEFKWMQKNAHKYGFILRYPKDGTLKTGYGYEPWHYRYVGLDAAKTIYEEKITFEEYYAYYILKK